MIRHNISLIIFTFSMLLGSGFSQAELPRDPAQHFFEQTLGDLRDDLEIAKEDSKRGILLFFEQEECPFCHRMKTTVLNQAAVQDYFKQHFLILSIDIESDAELIDFKGNTTTQKKFFAHIAKNRGATPVLAFIDLNGDLVVRYTGATTSVEEFMLLGEYASQGYYTQSSFTKFKRKRRREMRDS